MTRYSLKKSTAESAVGQKARRTGRRSCKQMGIARRKGPDVDSSNKVYNLALFQKHYPRMLDECRVVVLVVFVFAIRATHFEKSIKNYPINSLITP